MPKKYARKNGRPESGKGWKYTQSKKHIKERTKLALIVLAIILSFLLLSQITKFTQIIFRPWKQDPATKRTVLWNGDFNLNIAVLSQGISLLSFNPQTQKITIINIPDKTFLEAAHGFGKWQMRSIYDLGESQAIGGGRLLKDTLNNFFALPIDGFLQLSGKYSKKDTGFLVSELRKNLFSIIDILPNLKTDLTPFELWRLKMGLSSVRFDKIKEIDLEKTGLLQKDQLPDGTEVLTTDIIKLDSLLSDLIEPVLQSEHKTIAIFNSTGYPLLAQKAARLITNIGGDVIITANGQNNFKETKISGEKSKTMERLKQIFVVNDTINASDKDIVPSRAQINVFLGEDAFDRL